MNVFLVHGTFGKPFENWFPWIEAQLAKKEITCIIPSFPTPEHQKYEDWEILMDYYCKMGVINDETILVGHSCGTVFLVHYLWKHKIHVKGLVCVSGYNNFISGYDMMDELNESFYMAEEDLNMCKFADKVHVFYGDNDPNIPQQILHDFAVSIGGEEHCIPDAGHFNESAGYTTCDVVLEAVIDCMK